MYMANIHHRIDIKITILYAYTCTGCGVMHPRSKYSDLTHTNTVDFVQSTQIMTNFDDLGANLSNVCAFTMYGVRKLECIYDFAFQSTSIVNFVHSVQHTLPTIKFGNAKGHGTKTSKTSSKRQILHSKVKKPPSFLHSTTKIL